MNRVSAPRRSRIDVKLTSEPEATTKSARPKAAFSKSARPPGQCTTRRHAPSSGSTAANERANRSGSTGSADAALTSTADLTSSEKMPPSRPAPGRFPASTWTLSPGPMARRFPSFDATARSRLSRPPSSASSRAPNRSPRYSSNTSGSTCRSIGGDRPVVAGSCASACRRSSESGSSQRRMHRSMAARMSCTGRRTRCRRRRASSVSIIAVSSSGDGDESVPMDMRRPFL